MPQRQALTTLRTATAEAIETELHDLLQGAKGDLKAYALEITTDAIEAAQLPPARRDALLLELRGQLRALAEKNRLRAVNGAWDTAERVAMVGLKVAVAAVLAA